MRSPRTVAFGLLAFVLSFAIVAGRSVSPVAARAQSGLLSGPDGTLFLVYDDARHRISPATLAALGIEETSTQIVSQRQLEALAEAAPAPLLDQGALVVGPHGDFYLLFQGLHPIADEDVFKAYGWQGYQQFGPSPVVEVSAGLLGTARLRGPVLEDDWVSYRLFEWGQCTWWVAQRRMVAWKGNGGDWYANAQAAGFAVGDRPLPGAILVRRSPYGWSYGHVAYVESVNGTSFTVSEMNVRRAGELTTRTYDLVSDPPPGVIGYVYWRFGPEPGEEWGAVGRPERRGQTLVTLLDGPFDELYDRENVAR